MSIKTTTPIVFDFIFLPCLSVAFFRGMHLSAIDVNFVTFLCLKGNKLPCRNQLWNWTSAKRKVLRRVLDVYASSCKVNFSETADADDKQAVFPAVCLIAGSCQYHHESGRFCLTSIKLEEIARRFPAPSEINFRRPIWFRPVRMSHCTDGSVHCSQDLFR